MKSAENNQARYAIKLTFLCLYDFNMMLGNQIMQKKLKWVWAEIMQLEKVWQWDCTKEPSAFVGSENNC